MPRPKTVFFILVNACRAVAKESCGNNEEAVAAISFTAAISLSSAAYTGAYRFVLGLFTVTFWLSVKETT
jgi:hypothetical protein